MYKWCQRQKTEELHKLYVDKATNNLNKMLFFGMSAIWGYNVLKDSLWMPWFLGGQNPNASIMNTMIKEGDSGFEVIPEGCICYIFFTYGYHAQGLIEHVFFKPKQSDYRELLLHHITTNGLYCGYMMGNLFAVGTIIAWYHDVADIFVSASRAANCVGWRVRTWILYITLITLWIYTRCIIHPIFLYYIHHNYVHPNPSL